ncbi:unnamed protein product, partial [Ectocarpus sp. 6 AP-2014]
RLTYEVGFPHQICSSLSFVESFVRVESLSHCLRPFFSSNQRAECANDWSSVQKQPTTTPLQRKKHSYGIISSPFSPDSTAFEPPALNLPSTAPNQLLLTPAVLFNNMCTAQEGMHKQKTCYTLNLPRGLIS